MKKTFLITILTLSVLTLSGCSVQSVQESFQSAVQWVMQKDQVNEQGFEVTKELLEENLDKET